MTLTYAIPDHFPNIKPISHPNYSSLVSKLMSSSPCLYSVWSSLLPTLPVAIATRMPLPLLQDTQPCVAGETSLEHKWPELRCTARSFPAGRISSEAYLSFICVLVLPELLTTCTADIRVYGNTQVVEGGRNREQDAHPSQCPCVCIHATWRPDQCPAPSPCAHVPSVPTARNGCTLCL